MEITFGDMTLPITTRFLDFIITTEKQKKQKFITDFIVFVITKRLKYPISFIEPVKSAKYAKKNNCDCNISQKEILRIYG